MSSGNREILFEKFEIKECLKKDQYSSVYLADHIYLGKEIILKSLKLSEDLDKTIADRFKREAKILARLDHPNIIKVLDFGTFENHFYISFEYFRGKNLRELINRNDLNLDEKLSLTQQLLSGLNHAHNLGIIHRDIKPENIFVNEKLELKLGDFGLATSATENLVTEQNSLVGTPSYMSPEQIMGEELTSSTDLFSSGTVLFELFHGFNPFLGKDINETISRLLNYSEDKTAEKINSGNIELDELLKKMLKKSPSHRLQNAEEGLKILGMKKPEIYTSKKSTKNEKKVVGLFTIAAVIIAIVVFLPSRIEDEKPIPILKDTSTAVSEINSTDKGLEILPANIDEEFNASNEKQTINPDEVKTNLFQQVETDPLEKESIKYGELFVECIPWADVYLDSELVETTPIAKNIRIKTGKYNLKLVHPEFPKYNVGIEVDENKVTNIKVNLNELMAEIDFNVFPWAKVIINEKMVGETPLSESVKVIPGDVKITLQNPEFVSFDTTLTLSRGEKKRLVYKFKEQ